MDNNPKISIIVPCYNAEKYMGKMLDSVFGQSFKDFEIIFINDGSTDGTANLLRKCEQEHPEQVMIFEKENGGQSAARNMGIDAAKGDYIVFWDADDYADADYLKTLYNAAIEADSEMVISGSHYVDEYGNIMENTSYPVHLYPNYMGRRLSPHGKLYKRELLNRHHIRFAEGKLYEDNPFNFVAMFLCKNQVILPYALHYQVIHKNSTMSSNIKDEKMPYEAIEEAIKYVNAHRDEVNDYDCFEFTVLSFLTYFIFMGNRSHRQAANKQKRGYKNTTFVVKKLCDLTQRVIPEQFPNYYKNPHVGIFRERYLGFVWRAGVWCTTRLIRTHTLKLFAMIYYRFV